MNQFDPKIAEAMEHALKVQKIMTELGHTKYTICDIVSRQMLHDSEQEVSVLLGKLHKVTEQRDRLVEALRKAISWGDSASHHILHRQNINWTYLNEAKEALQSLNQPTEL